MRNDFQWILVVGVVNCAEELMVIVDGGDSGRCQRRQREARVTQAKAGRGREGARARARGQEGKDKRVRADKGTRARVRVDMAGNNDS